MVAETGYMCNVAEQHRYFEGMLVALLLLMLEVPGRPGTVIPCEALKVVELMQEMEEKRIARKKMTKPPTAMLATETSMALYEAIKV